MSRTRKHILFVCIGNLCRSPMAEAMARKYGSDVLVASSAGIAPVVQVHAVTRAVLQEKNIDPGEHVPCFFSSLKLDSYDLIVNMSGYELPGVFAVPVEVWDIPDPIGRSEQFFRQVRDEIEMRVMRLILRIRAGKLDTAIDEKAASSRQ